MDSTFIIGVFENPYNSKMGLDCLVCEQLAPDQAVLEAHPGKFSRVIDVKASTEGFNLNSCVALFAEHYVTDAGVRRENKACYFVDRFVTRYKNITQVMLNKCISEDSLSSARNASSETILAACCVWLHMHEYCHRLGNMPLPDFLDMKTPRDAASIEELRVDVLTVLLCYELAERGYPLAAKYGEIIFTERCFRYAVQYDITQNYDARGSAVLFSHLAGKGVIRTEMAGKIKVDGDALIPALRDIIMRIDELEMGLKSQDRVSNSQAKRALVRQYLNWNEIDRQYENHELIAPVAQSLTGVNLEFTYAT